MNQSELREKYLKTALEFIEKEKKKGITTVFITGSFFNKQLKKESDIDMFIVTEPGTDREKGISFVNNIKIGYFLNPVEKVYQILFSESQSIKKPTAEMIHFSECIFDKINQGKELKKLAKEIISKKLKPLKKTEKEYLGWKISDKISTVKRWQNTQTEEQLTYAIQDLFKHIIETFFRINKEYMPNTKYLLPKIETIDKKFFLLTKNYLEKKQSKEIILLGENLLEKMKFKENEYTEISKAY